MTWHDQNSLDFFLKKIKVGIFFEKKLERKKLIWAGLPISERES